MNDSAIHVHRYSVSQITQGRHKFYTLTMPSDVLSACCFVTTRYENPQEGFQRLLDTKRAEEIAAYIDEGLGTIPCSIILSAQPEAYLKIIGKGKTLQFHMHRKAFLIIDGQHRVYGFSLTRSSLRVPVVIYNGLSRRDETRLFIDINSKQKGVSSELLLDIKRMAEYETDVQSELRDLFDLFANNTDSALLGRCSPSSRETGKTSRVTFNSSVKPLLKVFGSQSVLDSYTILNSYLRAFAYGLKQKRLEKSLTGTIAFRAVAAFFPEVAAKVKDRYGSDYSEDNFHAVLEPMFDRIIPKRVKQPGNSYKVLLQHFSDSLKTEFSL